MLHLVGFSESQDSATLVPIAGLADPTVRVTGDDIIIPDELPFVVAILGFGPSLTQLRLVAPSLRRLSNYNIEPCDLAAVPSTPYAILDLRATPLVLAPRENLESEMSEGGAGATRGTVLVWLADGPVQPVEGETFVARYTSATAVVANVWSNIPLTPAEALPAGRYQIVGMRHRSATSQAARVYPVGSQWRPGVVGVATLAQLEHPMFRNGGMGVLGEFDQNTPPSVDVLANAADAAHVVHFDLIKVS